MSSLKKFFNKDNTLNIEKCFKNIKEENQLYYKHEYEKDFLYKSYKYDIYYKYLNSNDYKKLKKYDDKMKFYDQIKINILNKVNKNLSSAQIVKDIQKEYKIAFQTIYKYINTCKNETIKNSGILI